MFSKSKYDIMKKEMKGTTRSVISFTVKMLSLNRKAKKGKISDEQTRVDGVTLLEDLFPIMKKALHICYENSKDIETVGMEKVLSYIQDKGINPTQFAYNYNQQRKTTIKGLMAFAVLDRDNIQISSFKDPKTALKILNGDGFEDIIEDVRVSYDTMSTIKNITKEDFEVSDLSKEENQLLENYHNRYMTQNIYPRVTKKVTPERQVMEMAKKTLVKRNKITSTSL